MLGIAPSSASATVAYCEGLRMLENSFPRHSLKTRILLAIIGLIAVGMWSLSYFIS